MTGKDIPYPMLSDQDGSIGKLYGVYDDEGMINNRGMFIIDPEGIVQGYEVLTPSIGRNLFEALRQIKAYHHVRTSKGCEVTPAGWEPGKKTLKPGEALVGKVGEEWDVKKDLQG